MFNPNPGLANLGFYDAVSQTLAVEAWVGLQLHTLQLGLAHTFVGISTNMTNKTLVRNALSQIRAHVCKLDCGHLSSFTVRREVEYTLYQVRRMCMSVVCAHARKQHNRNRNASKG